nr:capsular polysaccharide synthesis protein [Segatella copri]
MPLKNDYHHLPIEKSANENIEYIWQCWLQGIEQAPDLVKMCLNSVEKYKKSNQKRIIITAENFADYLTLPTTIIEKWRKGNISNTQFSDILRINLLARYGGYWIDATCLLTQSTPEWMDKQPLFMYHAYGEFAFTQIQSCFMHAKPNNYIMQAWCLLMNTMWLHEKKLLHYFQLHLMFKALITSDSKAREDFQKMPVVSEKETQALMKFILSGTPNNQQELAKIKEKSFMHKLTYKKEIPDEFFSFYKSIN